MYFLRVAPICMSAPFITKRRKRRKNFCVRTTLDAVGCAAAAPGPLSKTTGEWHWSMATSASFLLLSHPLYTAVITRVRKEMVVAPSSETWRWYDDDAITRFVNIFTICIYLFIYLKKIKRAEQHFLGILPANDCNDFTSNGGCAPFVMFLMRHTRQTDARDYIPSMWGRSLAFVSWRGRGGREQERAFKTTTTPPLEQ